MGILGKAQAGKQVESALSEAEGAGV